MSGHHVFSKASLSPKDLVDKLESRGLVIPANVRAQAVEYVQFVGGYRLKGYYFHLLDVTTKMFPPGTTFQSIQERYEFDRHLRARTFEIITRIEMAVRSAIANYLSQTYGPHWFLNHAIFNSTSNWTYGGFLKKIEDEVFRSKNRTFVKTYFDRFSDPYLPPSWVIMECVTFGIWSRTYEALKDPADRKAISMKFGVGQTEVFASWLHNITLLRNTVAHHGRLLRHKFVSGPQGLKSKNLRFADAHSFYSSAVVIQFMLGQTSLPQAWKADLQVVFSNHPGVDIGDIGFPRNWTTTLPW